MGTHPEELKAEDRNDMAGGNGLEWGLAALQQPSQVDVGQRNTKGERDGCQTVTGVLKAGSVWNTQQLRDGDNSGAHALLEAPWSPF